MSDLGSASTLSADLAAEATEEAEEVVGGDDATHPADGTIPSWLGGEGLPPGADERRYVFGEVFASGGLGVVRRAEDRRLGRVIAVKELLRDSPEAQRRFAREAAITARLQHPSIVPLYDLGWRASKPFYCMKLVDGETLDAKIRAAVDLAQRLRLVEHVIAVADAIAYAHDQNIIHRDLKPANVLVGRFGETVVIDWGLAKDLSGDKAMDIARSSRRAADRAPEPDLTRDGAVMGTLRYMSPEQARGEAVDKRSDVYALGAILYHVLAGQAPFADDVGAMLWSRVSNGDLSSLESVDSAIPRELVAIAHRAMTVRAEDRYESAARFAEDLRRFQAGRMVSAHRYSRFERTRLWLRQRRVPLAIAAAIAVSGFSAFQVYQAQIDPCSGGRSTITAVWSDERRNAVAAALASAGPAFAAEVWPRVETTLDGYAHAWAGEHDDACLDHLRGELSDALFDRRVACLSESASALAQTAALLAERDQAVAFRALELASGLPRLARCSDIAALESEVLPPADLAVAAEVAALRKDLARIGPLEHAARQAEALDLARRTVQKAESIGYEPAYAEALLQRGKVFIHASQRSSDALRRALVMAVRSRADEVAAEAAVLLLYVQGTSGGSADALEGLPLAEALVARLPRSHHLHGLLLHNTAVVAVANGESERARDLYREALRVKQETLGSHDLEIAYTLFNLAMLADDRTEQTDSFLEAVTLFERHLGPVHPDTIQARVVTGNYMIDPNVSLELVRPACDALGRFAPDEAAQRGRCLGYIGHYYGELGAIDDMRAAFRAAGGLIDSASEQELSSLGFHELLLLRGLTAVAKGGGDSEIEAELRDTIRGIEGEKWWSRGNRAELELILGLLLRARFDATGAAVMMAAAVEDFVAIAVNVRDIISHQRLNHARIVLAELALSDGGNFPGRFVEVSQQLDAAMRWYADKGDAYQWRRKHIRALQGEIAGRDEPQ